MLSWWCNTSVIDDLTLLMILLCHLSVLSDFFHLLFKELLESYIVHGIISPTVISLLLPVGDSGYHFDSLLFLGHHHAGEQAVGGRTPDVVEVVGATRRPPLLLLLGLLHWGLPSIGFGHLPLPPVIIELLQPLPLLLFFSSPLRCLVLFIIQAYLSVVSTYQ